MNAPIQIRKPELARKIRELAELKGKSITDAVAEVVDRELDRVRQESAAELAARRARIEEIIARLAALPNVGPLLTDDDLYDEDGLPK